MKYLFKPQHFRWLIGILTLLLILKLIWFIVEVLWLPHSGVNHLETEGGKALYYRVKLTPNDAPPPKIKPKKVVQNTGNIQDLKLHAIYHAKDMTVVAVTYKGKSRVVGKGESVSGYVLQGAGRNFALFSRGGKTYKVFLEKSNNKSTIQEITVHSSGSDSSSSDDSQKVGEIVDLGDRKLVDRTLVNHYKKHLDEIGKNIGITEIKKGGALNGFKVTFIRRGSDFAKLGLKRDDVIKAINGQAVTSYKAAMDIYKKVDDMDSLTLKIERKNEEMELEYEIN